MATNGTTDTSALDTYKPPTAVLARGVTAAEWLTMRNLYPGGNPNSVLLVWDYCKARRLDPFKKPVHIVPLRVKEAGEWKTRDVVLPGIYEYRTTAHRTGQYRGHDKPLYGPEIEFAGVTAPAWCEFIVYRGGAGTPKDTWATFPVCTWFREVCATKGDGGANERWSKAPRQMLTKCAEAAALREAFPEEFGGEPTAEEMEGRTIDATTGADVVERRSDVPKPDKFDEWLHDMTAAADCGDEAFEAALLPSSKALRDYLVKVLPDQWEALKARAEAADRAHRAQQDGEVIE